MCVVNIVESEAVDPLLWKKQTTNVWVKTLVLQEQHINQFVLKSLFTACAVVQNGDKWDDSD